MTFHHQMASYILVIAYFSVHFYYSLFAFDSMLINPFFSKLRFVEPIFNTGNCCGDSS